MDALFKINDVLFERLINVGSNKYSTVLTGSGFLMPEFKRAAKLRLDGLSSDEITDKALNENVFQYNKPATLRRALPYLLNRIDVLDEQLLHMTVEDDIRTAKAINLYSIMKTDQLFFEFMNEVVRYKVTDTGSVLERKDVNVFFTNKIEQSGFLANLAESTVKRLQSQFVRLLIEAGMLKDRKTGELQRLLLDDNLRNYLIAIGDKKQVIAMAEYEA